MNAQRLFILALVGVLLAILFSGCGIFNARPLTNTNAVECVAFGNTNAVPDAVIAAGVTAVCAALGIPVTVGVSGLGVGSLVLIGIGVWRWAARRREEK